MLALAIKPADVSADLLAHQIELEKLFNKNQLIPRIRQEFQHCQDFDFGAYMVEQQIPLPFGFDLLTQMALHRRATLPILVGILRSHFDNSQVTADMIQRAAEADLVDWDPQLRLFIVRFTLSKDVQDELERFEYPLPMVVEPREITSNTETGYLLTGGSVILKKNHHNDDVCLDHLNRVNKTRFSIDHDTARMIKNRWKDLDKPKAGETADKFEKRKRAFLKYERTTKDVMDLLLKGGNEFYLTHKYDKRGRTYCQGYHVNYQGAAWNKAVVQLADKEMVE